MSGSSFGELALVGDTVGILSRAEMRDALGEAMVVCWDVERTFGLPNMKWSL